MIELIIRVVLRKFLVYVKFFGSRKNIFLVLASLVILSTCWWFALECSRIFQPPPPPLHSLEHFRRNRSLQYYLSQIQVLIEPSQSPCGSLEDVPVIVLVASAPVRFESRQAVRQTWAKYQRTYFVLGLHGDNMDEQLVDNYIEAKQFSDLIVFDFRDHYQNLTLKTALMIKWTLEQCPQAQFFFKTDDDVMVNPWTLRKVLKENVDNHLVGFTINDTTLQRSVYDKLYIPRWMYNEDKVSKSLAGSGYLINGDLLPSILNKAYEVPLINIEDIFFIYLVSHKGLGLKITHDKRLSPFKPWPWLPIGCFYWVLATMHSFEPQEMLTAWSRIEGLVHGLNDTKNVCQVFNSYFGYRRDAVSLHRDEYNKWFVPRWLYYEDKIDMYLSGTGYLINGDFLPSILKRAYQVPLINLEDIYFTHLVAHKGLGYTLTHDKRLSPFKPWLKITCIYWEFASIHNLEPQEMLSTWSKLENLVQDVDNTKDVCSFFESYFGKLGDLAMTF